METEIMKTIGVLKDSNGKIALVVDTKTTTLTKCRELKAQADNYQQELEIAKNQAEKEQNDKLTELSRKIAQNGLFIAKVVFDNLVDRGVFETTEEFESAFVDFVVNGKNIPTIVMPTNYKKLLERVGVRLWENY